MNTDACWRKVVLLLLIIGRLGCSDNAATSLSDTEMMGDSKGAPDIPDSHDTGGPLDTSEPPPTGPALYVSVYDDSRAYEGTTFFAYGYQDGHKIVELAMDGTVLYELALPQEWLPTGPAVGLEAELLANGHILIPISAKGIYEIDRQGTLLWFHDDPQVSHDADRLSTGNTLYVFGNNDAVGDAVVKEVGPDHELVWEWQFPEQYQQSYPPQEYSHQGWGHPNAVQRLSNGNTLVSIRNFYLTTIVDPTGKIVREFSWSGTGFGADTDPHEPQIYEDTKTLMVCLQNDAPYIAVEMDLETEEIRWTYSNPRIRTARDCDALPNGDVLIVAVDTGGTPNAQNMDDDFSTMLEVTRSGEIVWRLDFINAPVGANPGWFFKADRIHQ